MLERYGGRLPSPRVMITGSEGMLGRALADRLSGCGYSVCGFGRAALDVTDEAAVTDAVVGLRPDIVIHAAALTDIDRAERDADLAYRVNGYGTRNVAAAAEAAGAKLVYISTDQVFDGEGDEPYDEFARVNPVNVYGRSKWIGEYFAERLSTRFFIVRTSWLFGPDGGGCTEKVLRLAAGAPYLAVADDRTSCPTYTPDLADSIASLIGTSRYGIYHITNAGACTRLQLAETVCRLAGIEAEVRPLPSAHAVRLARRPAYTVLEPAALRLNGFAQPRPWQEALGSMLAERLPAAAGCAGLPV